MSWNFIITCLNAAEYAIQGTKLNTSLGRGTASSDPPPVKRGNPLSTPYPLGAYGASILVPLAVHLPQQLKNPRSATGP